jgi:hypothetical protein
MLIMSDQGRRVLTGGSANAACDAHARHVAMTAAVMALSLGALVYLLVRPDAVAFVPRALHRPLLVGPVIAQLAHWLPSFCHVLGFSLATALGAGFSRRSVTCSAMFWVAVNLLFEIGQHPAARDAVNGLLGGSSSWPLASVRQYCLNGTFDKADMAAAVVGAVAAWGIGCWATPRKLERGT